MRLLFQSLSAPALAFAVSVAAVPALRLARPWRNCVMLGAEAAVLLMPLLIPARPRPPFPRFLAAVWSVALFAKLLDLHASAGWSSKARLREILAFLPTPFSVCLRRLDAEPRPSARADLRRLLRSGGLLIVGLVWSVCVFRLDWRPWPFLVEHAVKVLALFAVLIPIAEVGASVLRLVGGRAREIMRHPYFARTPADFWTRYNRPAQQFFYEDIFKPCGGLRAPVRATLATFAFSAIVHEYVFAIPIGRVQGYQTAFFMLQGLAVAATWRIRPSGWSAIPWVAGTLAFNLASSTLFFASLSGVVPFYSRPLPCWLQFGT